MKITFVIPNLNLTGGIKVVGIYSKYLAEIGHDVNILYASPKKIGIKQWLKSFFSSAKTSTNNPVCPYFEHGLTDLKEINFWRNFEYSEIPDADVVIATFWLTAEWINKLPETKGKKIYFLQHYEMHPWLPLERVKATFQFPFKKIAVSGWIKEKVEENEHTLVDYVVLNGVDVSQFHAQPRGKNKKLRVGFMYSPREYKGCSIAINAINQVKHVVPDLEVITFAPEESSEAFLNEEFVKFIVNPPQNEIRHIYSQCDVWLFSSTCEGFGLPILEAMSCRTPVIATPAGAAPLLVNNENGILLNSYQSEDLAKAILHINSLSNDKWTELSNNSYKMAQLFSWDKSGKAFEDALLACIDTN